jgi:hypothetical protein
MCNRRSGLRLAGIGGLCFTALTIAGVVHSGTAKSPRQVPPFRPAQSIASDELPIPSGSAHGGSSVDSVATPSTFFGTNADNPKVEPGAVHWHPSMDDACKSSRESGKPVLLFQMMGKLDQRFC